ncbi:MAG TPA: hypothetical protein VF781_04040 [Solirubrobacteraceae bacterium]
MALAVVVVALAFVLLTGMRPAYDAYGWLVWGHQALHLNLNTNAAPSWKPLSFLFTLPYALLGRAALWLWMVTAVAAALAGAVFGGRIAYRLTIEDSPRWAASVAAALAGLAVLGIEGSAHFVLIAYSDPMIVTLCLAAIDFHLGGRPRVAFVMLALAALGRPEVWVALGLYAVWGWRWVPAMRRELVIGILAVLLLWFGVPILTSHNWFAAGDVASTSSTPIRGNKISGVINRFLGLYELPVQLAVVGALILAALRRDFRWLVLAAFAMLWVAVEIGFALHGWGASKRYMFEPAAVLVVLAAAGMGRVLGLSPRRAVVRWVGVAAVVGVVVAMVPHAQIRLRLLHNGIVLGRQWALQIHRLQSVIAKAGGTNAINACGQPVTTVPFQSILAWELGENVSAIGWSPPWWTSLNRPIVVFNPIGAGWVLTPVHTAPNMVKRCAHLNLKTSFDARTPGARVLKHKPTD